MSPLMQQRDVAAFQIADTNALLSYISRRRDQGKCYCATEKRQILALIGATETPVGVSPIAASYASTFGDDVGTIVI